MLCGWQDPQQMVAAPRLDPILAEATAGLIENYIKSLFGSVGIAALNGHLKPFCSVMLASVLMHHQEICQEYGFQNQLVRRLIDSAQTLGISNEDLVKWGAKIKKDWELRNAGNFRRSSTSREEKLEIQVGALIQDNADLKLDLKDVKCQLDKVMSVMESHFSGSPSRAPSPKRKRVIGTESQATGAALFGVMSQASDSIPKNPCVSDKALRNDRLQRLFSKMVEHRINHKNPNFGDQIDPKVKSKVTAVLTIFYQNTGNAYFTQEEKAYLFGTNRPLEKDNQHYGQWLTTLNLVCSSAEEKFLKSLTAQHNALADRFNQLCSDPSKQVKSRKLVSTKNNSRPRRWRHSPQKGSWYCIVRVGEDEDNEQHHQKTRTEYALVVS